MLSNCVWFCMKLAIWGVCIWLVGFVYSLLILIWLRFITYLLAAHFLGLVPLTSMDESWLLDSPENKCQPVCYVTFDKMNARELKRMILQRVVQNTTRMQCCLAKF